MRLAQQDAEIKRIENETPEHLKMKPSDLPPKIQRFELAKLGPDSDFKAKKYIQAIEKYEKLLRETSEDSEFTEEEQKDIFVRVKGSITQCFLNAGKLNEAIENAKTVLSVSPKHLKSQFRLARAHRMMKAMKEAEKLLLQGIEWCQNEAEKEDFQKELDSIFEEKKKEKARVLSEVKRKFEFDPSWQDSDFVEIQTVLEQVEPKEPEKNPEKPPSQKEKKNLNKTNSFEDYFKAKKESGKVSSDFLNLKDIDGKVIKSRRNLSLTDEQEETTSNRKVKFSIVFEGEFDLLD